jgi:hypothetical protein
MRTTTLVPLVLLVGCVTPENTRPQSTNEPITCNDGDIPIYSNTFTQTPGASGVATGADAVAGMTSSAPSTPITDATPTASDGQPLTAMMVECGKAHCASGQVGVEIPGMNPTGGVSGGPSSGASTTDTASPPSSSAPSGASAGSSSKPQIVCAPPPPSCPMGLSPQYTLKDTWECTDCALVVTYGGTYGNFRRCASAPTIVCPTDQVPTWVFENDDWECQPTCDNGQYDQHTIANQLVCVPC